LLGSTWAGCSNEFAASVLVFPRFPNSRMAASVEEMMPPEGDVPEEFPQHLYIAEN